MVAFYYLRDRTSQIWIQIAMHGLIIDSARQSSKTLYAPSEKVPIDSITMKRDSPFRFSSLVGRICIFLFFLDLVITFVYVLGSTQEFLDSSQALILQFFRVISLTYIFTALYFGAIHIVAMLRSREIHLLPLFLTIAGITVISSFYFGAEFILALLQEVG